MAQQTHYFLAIPIPSDIKGIISQWQELLKPKLPFKTWVHPQDLHITLFFLGHASFTQVNEVKKSVSEVVKHHGPFELQLNGIGTFGKKETPRIFWGGVDKPNALSQLQHEIAQACVERGFSSENRSYNPHITIARKWIDDQPFLIESANNIVYPKDEFTHFMVNEVVLYQTHLDRSPKYQPLSTFSLSGLKNV